MTIYIVTVPIDCKKVHMNNFKGEKYGQLVPIFVFFNTRLVLPILCVRTMGVHNSVW